ncbi:hypothetical protein EDC01DRAFT_712069 [Geopyxis carbonaria]|nr:hypothetical protein EDC01DRAFT_712069 [Geopyxis carbonaria]
MATPLRRLRALRALPSLTPTQRRTYAFGYTQSRALLHSEYGQPSSVLSLHAHSLPAAYGDEILIRFLASPINPADINQIEGTYPSKPPMTIALGTPVPAAVPGSEGVVEVVSTGANVPGTLFAPGDRAIMAKTAFGTWRTHALAPASALLKLPSDAADITDVQAATVSVNPTTAYQMLRHFTPLQAGDWVVQNGANSGVGRAAIQIAREWGVRTINIVRDRPELAALKTELTDLGADVVVAENELGREFSAKVKDLTQGKGAKLGLNCVGGKSASELIRLLGEGGHLVTYGGMARQPVTLGAGQQIFRDVHAHGFWVSRWSDQNPEAKMEVVKDVFSMIRRGVFREPPMTETRWGLKTGQEELVEAVKRSGEGFLGRKQVFVFDT